MAQRTPDAARQIDRADLHDARMLWTGDRVNAIHRADRQTRFAPRAKVFIQQSQNLGQLLLGHWCHYYKPPITPTPLAPPALSFVEGHAPSQSMAPP